jgi:hypothetical protein
MLPLAHDALFRALAGALFLSDLIGLLLYGFPRYVGPSFHTDSPLRSPARVWALAVVWGVAASALMLGIAPFVAACTLALLFRYQHVRLRYTSLARGAGAVGYMPWLVATYIAAWEGAALVAGRPSALHHAVEVAFTLEMAFILLCAGTAKALHGYVHGPGVELALANPFWSRAARWVQAHPPSHGVRLLLNRVGVGAEVLAGMLLLVPHATVRAVGALLVGCVFGWVALTLRLAGLPWLMLLIALRFLPPDAVEPVAPVVQWPEVVLTGFTAAVWGWIALLVTLRLAVWALFYRPSVRNTAVGRQIDRLAARVPVFVWRVFTADITNFFVRLSWQPAAPDAPRVVLFDETSRRAGDPRGRWAHCGEFVALSSVFSKAKYFGRDSATFHEFLRRYARSLQPPCEREGTLHATWVAIDPDTLQYLERFSVHVPTPDGAPVRLTEHDSAPLTASGSRVYAGSTFGSLVLAEPASDSNEVVAAP